MRLSDEYPRTLTDGRVVYHFKAPFDTVLFLNDVLSDGGLTPDDKIRLCVRLTFGVRLLWSARKKKRMLERLFELLQGDRGEKQDKEQILDFDQDAELIRSAFKQQYGIDLDRRRGSMSWFEFLERLSAITPDTLLGRVMEIRSTPIPAPTQYNREMRTRLMEQKAAFAIRKKARGAEQMDAMWDHIAEMLIEQAKGR